MFAAVFLFETVNNNLLLGFMPESIGLLLFGICLIAFAVGLRWFFDRQDKGNFNQMAANAHQSRK